jgi:hypothetical protein
MKTLKKIILAGLLFLGMQIHSQTVIGLGYTKYIGFNANPILAQVIPFNNINPRMTSAALMFRSYNFDDNGIRASYGLNLSGDNDFQSMTLSIDNDRRRSIGTSKWMYFQGFGVALKLVSENFNRSSTIPIDDEVTFSVGWHWGAEYQFNDVFSLSTEAILKLGVDLEEGSGFFKLEPPLNIIAHFNL